MSCSHLMESAATLQPPPLPPLSSAGTLSSHSAFSSTARFCAPRSADAPRHSTTPSLPSRHAATAELSAPSWSAAAPPPPPAAAASASITLSNVDEKAILRSEPPLPPRSTQTLRSAGSQRTWPRRVAEDDEEEAPQQYTEDFIG